MKVRIGIDVGGTFTDAAVINDANYELIGSVKVPTTHGAKEGVAKGIKDVLMLSMEKFNIKAEDVSFIAHGTTQATNALLEGDVSKVGVITVGEGLEGLKSKNDTIFSPIELAPNKYLNTLSHYVTLDGSIENSDREISEILGKFKEDNFETIVTAEAFSVNDPKNENYIVEMARGIGIPTTATNEISKLYGLKVRTRTAVINASILPKMLETANMTESSIKNAGIKAPLMVMRCDGGVMNIDEVRNRPILTILSGPAAGVAGALMYEKLTNGIFFEVGGTSTDISCVKDGKVMIKYAEVGGHQTYLNSLDVRTVGIGGGSMLQIQNGKIVDTGPRSAHIADIPYDCYANPKDIVNPVLKSIKPKETDPDYAYVECENGDTYCHTVSGAATLLGFIEEGDYAYGNIEATRKIWQPLADSMKMTVEDVASLALENAAKKNGEIVNQLMKDYDLDPRTTELIGGGGGAATVVPHLGKTLQMKNRLAKNASVISTIGVALAMVRELVERGVANPTKEDILSVRREAEAAVIKSGANPETVEIQVEVDSQRNVIRAIATGATEMRAKDLLNRYLSKDQLLDKAAENLDVDSDSLKIAGDNGSMLAIIYENKRKLFKIFTQIKKNLVLIDYEGVIRLQKNNAQVYTTQKKDIKSQLKKILGELTEYNDGGAQLPNIYVIDDTKIIDLSGLTDEPQVLALANVELSSVENDKKLIIISTNRADI